MPSCRSLANRAVSASARLGSRLTSACPPGLDVVAAVSTNGELAGMYASAVATGLGGALELLLEPHPATSTAAATIARIRARRTAERLLRRRGAWRTSGDRLGLHV